MLDHPAIDVRDIRKTYPGGVEAVRGLGFQVGAGEVFGLLGPNGAGKSTTIGMLTTTVAPTSGSARVAGFDVATEPRAARRVSGIVFQDSAIDRALTGRRNLDIHARLWGVEQGAASRRVEELAETLDLGELLARAVATYSGGERRRLEIARALVSEPRVLFLDEPTVGLDPRIRHELLEVIGRLRDRTEMTIMLTTHYLDEAERLCDRVAIIHAGQIIALDTPAALVAGLGDELVELRVSHDPAAALASLRAHGIAGDDAFSVGSTLTVPVHHSTAAAAMAGIHDAGLGASSITARRPTLDDVYLQLTGGRFAEAA
ncbi:MAG TPA: ABC transporter ATP-binding protein [Gaiellales bacterium]|nr:ABC transporter ATP-binding protein [Gaiellales bacterium]